MQSKYKVHFSLLSIIIIHAFTFLHAFISVYILSALSVLFFAYFWQISVFITRTHSVVVLN